MLFSRPKDELTLIIDLQSSIVRGTLVHCVHGQLPAIIHTESVAIPYRQHARSGYLIKSAVKGIEHIIESHLLALSQITEAARHKDVPPPGHISSVHFILSSPWIVSQAKTLSFSFDAHTAVDRSYIRSLIEQDRAKLMKDTPGDIRVIEEKVFDVRLNGYSVASWESRQTRELEVSFVVSVAGGRMADRLIDACSKIASRGKVHFHSSLLLQHLGMKIVMPHTPTYAIIHAHGELTDVAIVHTDSCVFFGSYPVGVHTLVRTIARETHLDEKSADSLLEMTQQGGMDPSLAKKESLIVSNMGDRWVGELRKLLASSPSTISMPGFAFVSAHDHNDFFSSNLSRAYPHLKIEQLTKEHMKAHVAFEHPSAELLSGLYIIAIHSLEK